MTVSSKRLKLKQIPQKSSAISLNVTNKASIALGFVNLTRCACPPPPPSCAGLYSTEGYNHPKNLTSSYFHINLPLDSMSFQPTRECDEWPNECIITVVGVWTIAWRTVLCCTAGTLSSISCRVWAKCPPDFLYNHERLWDSASVGSQGRIYGSL